MIPYKGLVKGAYTFLKTLKLFWKFYKAYGIKQSFTTLVVTPKKLKIGEGEVTLKD